MRRKTIWLVLGLMALSSIAALARAEVVPQVELGVGETGEALTVPAASGEVTEERGLYTTRLALGLSYPVLDGLAPLGGRFAGRSALATDVLLGPGRWALTAEQDLRWQRPLGDDWRLSIGLGLAGRLDLERPAFSTVELGLPVGVGWGPLELDWRPALRIPLGAEEAAVFGGARTHGASTGINLLALALRVHLTGLAW